MNKRNILAVIILLAGFTAVQAQVFNAARPLSRKQFYLGLEPAIYAKSGTDVFMFFHGGVGITNQVGLALHAGVGPTTYLGADLQWSLAQRLQLTTGAHNFDNFGLNGAITYRIPVVKGTDFWFGADMDVDFASDIEVPLWIPIGVEIGFRDNISFILESEIGLDSPARHIIAGGLSIYLR